MLVPKPLIALLAALATALAVLSTMAVVTANRADHNARHLAINTAKIAALESADSAILQDGARAHYRLCLRVNDNRAAINDITPTRPPLPLYDCTPNLQNLPPTLLNAKQARAFQQNARQHNYLP